MSRGSILLLFILFSFAAAGQCDNSLLGKWKVVAVLNVGSYINLKTDSVYFPTYMANKYATDSLKRIFIKEQKEMYQNAFFHFKTDSSLNANMLGDYTEDIRYCYKKSENKIHLISKNETGEKVINERTTLIKNGLLHITISPVEMKDYIFEIVLEKTATK